MGVTIITNTSLSVECHKNGRGLHCVMLTSDTFKTKVERTNTQQITYRIPKATETNEAQSRFVRTSLRSVLNNTEKIFKKHSC